MSFQGHQVGDKYNKKDGKDILLDTGSTHSVFKNDKMLLNICKRTTTLRAFTNGGVQDSSMVAELPGFFKVWFNPKSMVNILSWADVRKKFRITADTAKEATIFVHMEDGKKLKFEEIGSGLYLLKNMNNDILKPVSGYSFLTLVKTNKSIFTTRELERADKSIELHQKLGSPGYKQFFRILEKGQIRDCPITTDDVKSAIHIYGPDMVTIKGKMVRRKPRAIHSKMKIPLPKTIQELHLAINLSADYLFVQSIPILHTILRNYRFRTVEALISKKG